MMHVRFNEAWHGKVHKQSYKLSGAHYATELHIEENKTIPEIAEIEGVCRTKIDKSIAQGLKKLKIFLKTGGVN